jgi:SAM-dependent methyltransferase
VSEHQTRPNAEQARAWDGTEGDTWTEHEDWYNDAQRYLSPHLLDGAGIAPSDRVLDIGCGCGETTRAAAGRAPAGEAFGIDLSSRMISRARERAVAEGIGNVRFEQGDAQVYPFEPASFELAISRYGTMFFDDPVAAFTNVSGALSHGGRLAILCWNRLRHNEWLLEVRSALAAGRDLPEPPADAPGALSFADPERVRSILEAAGFTAVGFHEIAEPMYFGPDASRAYESVTRLGIVGGLLADLDGRARAGALDALRRTIVDHETPEGVLLGTNSWLIRATVAH